MKFRHDLTYDAPPADVFAMLSDPAFREAACAAQDVISADVEITERGGDWRAVDSGEMPLGAPNWRSPNWAPEMPNKANYRALGLADLASAVLNGTPHRSSGRLGLHVLEVMHSILEARCLIVN